MYATTTKNGFEVGIHKTGDHGYFEHEEYGEEIGGQLWFENYRLVDFDGVIVLPEEVADIIQSLGLEADKDQFCDK